LKKKNLLIVTALYIIYGLIIWLYLFHIAPHGIADAYVNSFADPSTFMSSSDINTSIVFARIRHLIFFLSTPFEWLIIAYFMFGGLSEKIEEKIKQLFAKTFIQTSVYYFAFSFILFLAMLPFRFISYQVARHFGTSTMQLSLWIRNRGIDFLVDFILYMIIIHIVMYVIKKFPKKWWLVTWGLFIPFAFFFMFLQPVIIDPLYNDFTNLQNDNLELQILNMAQEAGIMADSVFIMEVSDRTNTINGYVTGVGSTARIVLWDTALSALNEDAIMFLMAHEIAHYVNHDIYRAIVVAIVFAFFGLFILAQILKHQDRKSFKRIPLAFLVIGILLFAFSPITNAISRHIEKSADVFALELTNDPEGGIELFQTLARTSLNEVNPPTLVRIFRSTHPSIFERIRMLEDVLLD